MSLCKVFLVGRIGAAPELRSSSAGNPWCVLHVATNRRVRDGEGWTEKTSWHAVKVFGDRAESCHRLLRKGSLVGVEGEIETERWTDRDGREHRGVSVLARRVEFLADFGRTRVEGVAPPD